MELHIYTAEHHVVLCPDVWRIISFDEGKVGAHVAIESHVSIVCQNPITRQRTLLSEVHLIGLLEAGNLVGACFCILLACTGLSERGYSREEGSHG